jgi:hypothetical protein
VLFGRYLRDDGPGDHVWHDRSTIGQSTALEVDDDDWTVMRFHCKTCRDQGQPQTSEVTRAEVTGAVNDLWERCADAPIRQALQTRWV